MQTERPVNNADQEQSKHFKETKIAVYAQLDLKIIPIQLCAFLALLESIARVSKQGLVSIVQMGPRAQRQILLAILGSL